MFGKIASARTFDAPHSENRVNYGFLSGRKMEGGWRGMRITSSFGHFSRRIARAMGQPVAFGAALVIILLWGVAGPVFNYSDTWQLIINTGTTIITFLMVFLIQNTQNRDAEAAQIKLDELIRAIDHAHNALLNLEELEEKDLDLIRADYVRLAMRARNELRGEDRAQQH
ncbi:MAG: low affinity iron permease family protein [Chloroflexota bacterium]